MDFKNISEEEFRVRLNVKKPVEIYGLQVKQYTLDDVLDKTGYLRFNRLRNFVNLSIDSFEYGVSKEIDDYMFTIKESLMMSYPYAGYDIDYNLYDMCCHVPFIKNMFIDFLYAFTIGCEDILVEHNPNFNKLTILYTNLNKSEDNDKEKIEQLTLDKVQFDDFIDLFSILNFTVRVDHSMVKDSESVKEFDKKAEEIKSQYGFKSRQDITLESITSSLIDSGNTSYNHENIGGKTIYQIMNSFNRMCKIKDNEFMNLVRVNSSKIKDDDIKKNMWYYNLY